MSLRPILAVALATILLPAAGASAATPKGHARHHAARVSTATYHTPIGHKHVRELRTQRHTTRMAAGQPRHHSLSRGS